MGTKMAAAFPGLHDRLEHFTSAPVIMPAAGVEAGKLDEDDALVPPNAVGEATLPELIVEEP
jgi:hypothetical protein